MKKMILVVVALLSMTATFAEDNKANNAQLFDMSVNYNKLGEALNLNNDQLESLQDVHKAFCAEMLNAAYADKDEQKVMAWLKFEAKGLLEIRRELYSLTSEIDKCFVINEALVVQQK